MAESYWATADLNGNVIGLVSTVNPAEMTAPRIAVYDYDAFGNPIRVNEPEEGLNPIRFSSKYMDAETGLAYYGFRYYWPALGKWLSRDPIEEDGGLNLYGMVGNDAVNEIDALGLSPEKLKRCLELLKECAEQSGKLVKELLKYNPDTDVGGHPHRWGVTVPGGHYYEILSLQQGLRNKIQSFARHCLDDNNQWPKAMQKLASLNIPRPPAIGGTSAQALQGLKYEALGILSELPGYSATARSAMMQSPAFDDEALGDAAKVAGTAVGCYVTYRIVRIIVNAAIPVTWPLLPANGLSP